MFTLNASQRPMNWCLMRWRLWRRWRRKLRRGVIEKSPNDWSDDIISYRNPPNSHKTELNDKIHWCFYGEYRGIFFYNYGSCSFIVFFHNAVYVIAVSWVGHYVVAILTTSQFIWSLRMFLPAQLYLIREDHTQSAIYNANVLWALAAIGSGRNDISSSVNKELSRHSAGYPNEFSSVF